MLRKLKFDLNFFRFWFFFGGGDQMHLMSIWDTILQLL